MNKGILYVAVGLPGSGKTTFVNNYPYLYWHSSDEVRERILGDVNDQEHNKIVFDTLHQEIKTDLAMGRHCYYDATNLTTSIRKDIVRRFRNYAEDIIAVYFNEPVEVCKERNSKRERVVPEEVIDRMALKMTAPELGEGFDEIFYLNPLDKLPKV